MIAVGMPIEAGAGGHRKCRDHHRGALLALVRGRTLSVWRHKLAA